MMNVNTSEKDYVAENSSESEFQQNDESVNYNSSYVSKASEIEKNIYNLLLEREIQINDYTFSFSGIKRMLGDVHQQTLSNALEHLLEEDVITKNDVGYTLNSTLIESQHNKKLGYKEKNNTSWDYSWIARASQYSYPVSKILAILRGKWFGKFRFIGYSEKKNGAILEWTDINGHGILRFEIYQWTIHLYSKNLTKKDMSSAIRIIQSIFFQHNLLIQLEEDNYINKRNIKN